MEEEEWFVLTIMASDYVNFIFLYITSYLRKWMESWHAVSQVKSTTQCPYEHHSDRVCTEDPEFATWARGYNLVIKYLIFHNSNAVREWNIKITAHFSNKATKTAVTLLNFGDPLPLQHRIQ